MAKYWRMQARATGTAEILIYETIGGSFWEEGIGAKQFAEDLHALGNVAVLDIRINSPGGSVPEGLAIYNTLLRHGARKHVYIDGIAASIASVIAMAGDRVIMPQNALLMVHDPTAYVEGTEEDMRKMAEALGKAKLGLISAYKRKSALTDDEIAALMTAETWMTADEAKQKGFVDEVIGAVQVAAHFDLSKFKNVHFSTEKTDKQEGKKMDEGQVKEVRDEARQAERDRVAGILALGAQHRCQELAQTAVKEGIPVDDFKGRVLQAVYGAKQADNISGEIGMTQAEARQFSLVRAIRSLAELKPLDGIEKEASDAVAKVARREARGFFIPQDVLRAATMRNSLSAGDATRGGYFVGTDLLAGDMIELLRNKMYVASLGARYLPGLVGNIAIPRITGGAQAFWLPETGEVTPSAQATGQLGLRPNRLVGSTAYSKELLAQASVDVEAFVREDLMTVLAIEKDRAAIDGSGVNGQPMGILSTTGIGSVTFGAAATWAKVVDFETSVAEANADVGSMAYLTTPGVRGKWKTIVKFASTASPLWEGVGTVGAGVVNGYRAEATRQVPNNRVIFGNWADLILADWAGIDVVVDPYSLKRSGQIEITVTVWTDCGVRRPASFCASSDAGNQ